MALPGIFLSWFLSLYWLGCYGFHLLSSHVVMMWRITPVTIVNKANSGTVNVNISLYCQILYGSKVQYSIVPIFSMSNFVGGLKNFFINCNFCQLLKCWIDIYNIKIYECLLIMSKYWLIVYKGLWRKYYYCIIKYKM